MSASAMQGGHNKEEKLKTKTYMPTSDCSMRNVLGYYKAINHQLLAPIRLLQCQYKNVERARAIS